MEIKREFNGMTLSIPLTDNEIQKIAEEYNRHFFCFPIEECIRLQYASLVKSVCPNADDNSCRLDDMDDDVRFQAFVHSEIAWEWFRASREAVVNSFWEDYLKRENPIKLSLEWASQGHALVKHGDCYILQISQDHLDVWDWAFVSKHWQAIEEFCKAINWKDARSDG